MIMSLQIKDADNFAIGFTFWAVMNLRSLNSLVFPFMMLFVNLIKFCGIDFFHFYFSHSI